MHARSALPSSLFGTYVQVVVSPGSTPSACINARAKPLGVVAAVAVRAAAKVGRVGLLPVHPATICSMLQGFFPVSVSVFGGVLLLLPS